MWYFSLFSSELQHSIKKEKSFTEEEIKGKSSQYL